MVNIKPRLPGHYVEQVQQPLATPIRLGLTLLLIRTVPESVPSPTSQHTLDSL